MKSISLMAAAFLAMAQSASAESSVLKVYTYDSFVSDWGPGPLVEAAFEEKCGCDLQFVGAGDGASLLARIRLEGARTDADVVLGLDTNLTAVAANSGIFGTHDLDLSDLDLPVVWQDDMFVPFDWGYFAFVHNTDLANPPTSFEDLIALPEETKIVIQDPRSSTPGLGLLLWVQAAYGKDAARIWEGLAPHILTVTKGWSEAYGLFLEGEADLVLSYTTSPAYHLIAENDAGKTAAAFSEGHYLQIEVAAKVASSPHQELADQFLGFILSEDFQSIIPTTNWMFPVKTPAAGLPEGFETLISPETALLFEAGQAPRVRDAALQTWLTALSR